MGKVSGVSGLPTPGIKASEKVFGKTDRKAKEIEKLNADIQKVDEDTKTIKQKLTATNSRLENLDKELKELKIGDVSKAKILLEKSANADKLIEALKQEVARLKKLKAETPQNPESLIRDKLYVSCCLTPIGEEQGEDDRRH